MAEEELFSSGVEFNEVGHEFNEGYLSDVQGTRASVSTKDVESSVSEAEPASTVPAGEATAEVASGTAAVAETSSVGVVVTTTGAAVTTTGVIIVVGAGLLTSAIITFRSFEFSPDPVDKAIYYSLAVEYDNDATLYVHLLDEENKEISKNEHEIVIADAYEEEDIKWTDVSGEFTDLSYNTAYLIEAYYFDGLENKIVYRSEEPIIIEQIPSVHVSIEGFEYSGDPIEKAIYYAFTAEYDNDVTLSVRLLDQENNVIATSDHEILLADAYEEETEQENIKYTFVEGSFTDLSYDIPYTIEASYFDGVETQIAYTSEKSIILEQVPSVHIKVDNFKYSTDPVNKTIDYSLNIELDNDATLYVSLYNEEGTELTRQEHNVFIEDAYQDNGISYLDIEDQFTDLAYDTVYEIKVSYYNGIEEELAYETEQSIIIEYNSLGLTSISYSIDAKRKAFSATVEVYYDEDAMENNSVYAYLYDADQEVVGEKYIPLLDGGQGGDAGGEGNSEFIEYSNGQFGVKSTFAFKDLTPGVTYSLAVVAREYTQSQDLLTTELGRQEIYLEEADSYLPYVSLLSYSADYNDSVLELYYDYYSNGVTYDEYAIFVENINWTGTLSGDYQTMDGAPTADAYIVNMEGAPGYNYKINLCARNTGDTTYVVLAQNAIYY